MTFVDRLVRDIFTQNVNHTELTASLELLSVSADIEPFVEIQNLVAFFSQLRDLFFVIRLNFTLAELRFLMEKQRRNLMTPSNAPSTLLPATSLDHWQNAVTLLRQYFFDDIMSCLFDCKLSIALRTFLSSSLHSACRLLILFDCPQQLDDHILLINGMVQFGIEHGEGGVGLLSTREMDLTRHQQFANSKRGGLGNTFQTVKSSASTNCNHPSSSNDNAHPDQNSLPAHSSETVSSSSSSVRSSGDFNSSQDNSYRSNPHIDAQSQQPQLLDVTLLAILATKCHEIYRQFAISSRKVGDDGSGCIHDHVDAVLLNWCENAQKIRTLKANSSSQRHLAMKSKTYSALLKALPDISHYFYVIRINGILVAVAPFIKLAMIERF